MHNGLADGKHKKLFANKLALITTNTKSVLDNDNEIVFDFKRDKDGQTFKTDPWRLFLDRLYK